MISALKDIFCWESIKGMDPLHKMLIPVFVIAITLMACNAQDTETTSTITTCQQTTPEENLMLTQKTYPNAMRLEDVRGDKYLARDTLNRVVIISNISTCNGYKGVATILIP